MTFDKTILDEFAAESLEHLEKMENEILFLFRGEGKEEHKRIDRIFRSVHSIKGAAGFLRLGQIEKLSHAMENLLSALRPEGADSGPEVTDILLEAIDTLRKMFDNIQQSNGIDISEVYHHLMLLLERSDPDLPPPASESGGEKEAETETEGEISFSIPVSVLKNLPASGDFLYALRYDFDALRKSRGKSPVAIIRELLSAGRILDSAIHECSDDLLHSVPEGPLLYFVLYASSLEKDALCNTLGLPESEAVLLDRETVLHPDTEKRDIFPAWISLEAESPENASGMPPESSFRKNASPLPENSRDFRKKKEYAVPFSQTETKKTAESAGYMGIRQNDIRIDLGKLDTLINLVGELVIAESAVTGHYGHDTEEFEHAARNLHRIISDIQDVALSVRMIPLSHTFRRLSRLVHDLSGKLGKPCRLETAGEDTELDKTVIEQISDPLLHIIRNSLDHGIESPEERKKAGKAQIGTIRIEARHKGGEVLIRIRDDGKGLDREKILAKAFEKGFIREDRMHLDSQHIDRLIFEPGFSTVDRVTDISGRGVGLDVVKKNIEKLNGRIDIRSLPQQGTSFLLRIPLTMAIIDGMLLRVGNSCYTVPLLSVRESFRPLPEQISLTMGEQELVSIRKEMVPVLRLHEMYGIEPDMRELHKGILVHVFSAQHNVCLFADEIIGQHQTVIKKMPGYVAAKGISGCTILSSGEVSLILDVGSIIDEQLSGNSCQG
ncbi:MAG: chemotaxis protein CheA [Desulfococcaceae bacterium]|jgi:two-component system chemotaxis sensor kinase CheA|nr:chemotaxis protein CheA [Desulfococcaceae bacterium]